MPVNAFINGWYLAFATAITMLCPKCKHEIPLLKEQAQTIEILESQVRQLSQKLAYSGFLKFILRILLTVLVDKAADLEDALQAYRKSSPVPSTLSSTVANTNANPSPSPEPPFSTTQSRLASFLASQRPTIFGSRSSTPTRSNLSKIGPSNSNLPLEEQIQLERAAREQAEQKVTSMTQELEDLTQSLFEEANAMVRIEREKYARLESRLQLMESREEDKKRRLNELEKAIARITKVRNVLENKTAVVNVG